MGDAQRHEEPFVRARHNRRTCASLTRQRRSRLFTWCQPPLLSSFVFKRASSTPPPPSDAVRRLCPASGSPLLHRDRCQQFPRGYFRPSRPPSRRSSRGMDSNIERRASGSGTRRYCQSLGFPATFLSIPFIWPPDLLSPIPPSPSCAREACTLNFQCAFQSRWRKQSTLH
jgi:hypothetical protein